MATNDDQLSAMAEIPCSWCGFNPAVPGQNECELCSKSLHNRSDIENKPATVLELVRKIVSGRRLLNIGERQATLEAWYENNPNVTNEYREAEAALDTLAALLASLDAGENPPTEET